MSQFNPDSFLDATITEPTTRRPPIPAGLDFIGVVEKVDAKNVTGTKDPSKTYNIVDITVKLDLTSRPDIVTQLGVDSVLLTDGIMLDTTPGGAIDNGPGKNGKLRRYREALDMNKPGDAFSFRNMIGRMIRVKIKHETYEGEIYDKVDSIARA